MRLRMKYLVSWLLVLGMTLLIPSTLVEASSLAPELILPHPLVQEDLVDDLQEASQKLLAADRFQARYRFVNLRNQQVMADVTFLGDQASQNLKGDLVFTYRDAYPDRYHLEFLAYHNFDLVYVKLVDYLASMAYFQQMIFPEELFYHLEEYQEAYVAVETQVKEPKEAWTFAQPFFYFPAVTDLHALEPQTLWRFGSQVHVQAERLEIPEGIFDQAGALGLSFDLRGKIHATDRGPQVDYQHELRVTPLDEAPQVTLGVETGFDRELLGYGFDRVRLDPFVREMVFDSREVTDRLIKMDLCLDEDQESYQVFLEGISERVNWNLFEDQPSSFKTYDFGIAYDYQADPEGEIPALDQIQRMSQAEFNYLLSQWLQE